MGASPHSTLCYHMLLYYLMISDMWGAWVATLLKIKTKLINLLNRVFKKFAKIEKSKINSSIVFEIALNDESCNIHVQSQWRLIFPCKYIINLGQKAFLLNLLTFEKPIFVPQKQRNDIAMIRLRTRCVTHSSRKTVIGPVNKKNR